MGRGGSRATRAPVFIDPGGHGRGVRFVDFQFVYLGDPIMPLTALGGVLAVRSLAAVNGGMTRLDKSTTKGSVVTEQLQLLLRPEDFAISPEGLFSAGADAWRAYARDEGYLRIRPALHEGAVGLQGTLALGIPPSVEEVDAWEASRPAGATRRRSAHPNWSERAGPRQRTREPCWSSQNRGLVPRADGREGAIRKFAFHPSMW